MTTNTADLLYAAGAVAAMGVAVYMLSSPTGKESGGFQVCTKDKSCSDPTFKPNDFSHDPTDPNWSPTVGDMAKVLVDAVESVPQSAENLYNGVMGVITDTNPDGSFGCVYTSDLTDPRCIEPAKNAQGLSGTDSASFATFNDFLDGLKNQSITQLGSGCFGNVTIAMPDGSYKTMVACDSERHCWDQTSANGEVCAIYGGTGAGKTVTVINGAAQAAPIQQVESDIYQNQGVADFAAELAKIDYTKYGTTIPYANVGVKVPVGSWSGPNWFKGNPGQCAQSYTFTKDQWDKLGTWKQLPYATLYQTTKAGGSGPCFTWQ